MLRRHDVLETRGILIDKMNAQVCNHLGWVSDNSDRAATVDLYEFPNWLVLRSSCSHPSRVLDVSSPSSVIIYDLPINFFRDLRPARALRRSFRQSEQQFQWDNIPPLLKPSASLSFIARDVGSRTWTDWGGFYVYSLIVGTVRLGSPPGGGHMNPVAVTTGG